MCQQFLVSVGKKRVGTTTKRPVVETGTTNPNDVDYDWLPKETLKSLSKCERSLFYKVKSCISGIREFLSFYSPSLLFQELFGNWSSQYFLFILRGFQFLLLHRWFPFQNPFWEVVKTPNVYQKGHFSSILYCCCSVKVTIGVLNAELPLTLLI